MIGWTLLGLGLGAPMVVDLLVRLAAKVIPQPRFAGRKLPARWPPVAALVGPPLVCFLGAWQLLSVTKTRVVVGLAAWGLSHLMREVSSAVQAHRDLQRFTIEINSQNRLPGRR